MTLITRKGKKLNPINYKTIWGQKNHLKWPPIGSKKKSFESPFIGGGKKNHLKWSSIGSLKKCHLNWLRKKH
jgi:hypothetical protein